MIMLPDRNLNAIYHSDIHEILIRQNTNDNLVLAPMTISVKNVMVSRFSVENMLFLMTLVSYCQIQLISI